MKIRSVESYKHSGDQIRRNLSYLLKYFIVEVREGPKDRVKNGESVNLCVLSILPLS